MGELLVLSIRPDIDECAMETDMCDMNANCTNTDGSYDCTCDNGYSGDGLTCSECLIVKKMLSMNDLFS